MIFTKLLRFVRGFVLLEITGPFLERFINIISLKGLNPWNVKRINADKILLFLSVKDFKRIKSLRRKTFCKIHILSKQGLPFILRKYKKRLGLFIGALLFFALVFLMSFFVWSIEISGQTSLKEEEIIVALEECGFKEGSFKGNLNLRSIRQKMKVKLPEISFIELNIKGSKAYVEITEAKKHSEILNANQPCNIVASKSAVVERVEVTIGLPLVEKGDIVEKGSLLVSGIIDSPKAGYFLVHSRAKIFASSSQTLQVFTPYETEIFQRTGAFCKKNRIRICNFYINLYFRGGIDYPIYDKIIRTKEAKIGSVVLPIAFEQQIFYEKVSKIKTASEKEAENKSLALLEETARYEFENKQVVSKETEVSFSEEGCTATGTYIVIEDIAKELPIETERKQKVGTDS